MRGVGHLGDKYSTDELLERFGDMLGVMTTPNPPVIPATLGRIVMYTLNDGDVRAIRDRRNATGILLNRDASDVAVGQMFAAQVVKLWGDPGNHDAAVNLVVQLDGTDTYWATSRTEGAGPGHWHWPSRVH